MLTCLFHLNTNVFLRIIKTHLANQKQFQHHILVIAQAYALGILKILDGLEQKNWDLFIIFNFMPRMPHCQVIFVINARQAKEKDFSFRSWYFPVELSVCLSFCLFLKRNYVLISSDLSFSHDVISDCALSYTPPGYGLSWPSSSQWNFFLCRMWCMANKCFLDTFICLMRRWIISCDPQAKWLK